MARKNVVELSVTLGNRYKDSVTGFEGVATACYIYMNGCIRVELMALDKDGVPKAYVFDQEQMLEVKGAPVERKAATPTGGPRGTTPVKR
jgi:hypothetical protein